MRLPDFDLLRGFVLAEADKVKPRIVVFTSYDADIYLIGKQLQLGRRGIPIYGGLGPRLPTAWREGNSPLERPGSIPFLAFCANA